MTPDIHTCLLRTMSLWVRGVGKVFFSLRSLPCQRTRMAVSFPRVSSDHPAAASLVGSAVCRSGDSDTAAAAEWNQWWMTCQKGPHCLAWRLYWQAHLSHLAFGINGANPRSSEPWMGCMNIAPLIAHLSPSDLGGTKKWVFTATLLTRNRLWWKENKDNSEFHNFFYT